MKKYKNGTQVRKALWEFSHGSEKKNIGGDKNPNEIVLKSKRWRGRKKGNFSSPVFKTKRKNIFDFRLKN